MPPRTRQIGRSVSAGTLFKECMSGNQSTTHKRIYEQTDERLRYLSQETDIILADSLYMVNVPNALCKSTTIYPSVQTVINPTVFVQFQQELQLIQRKIIPCGHSTAETISPLTGKTVTLPHGHPDYYMQKCFLFCIHKAFELFGDDLFKTSPSMQDTVPKMLQHFTTYASEITFLRNLVELLNSKNVLFSLMDSNSLGLHI